MAGKPFMRDGNTKTEGFAEQAAAQSHRQNPNHEKKGQLGHTQCRRAPDFPNDENSKEERKQWEQSNRQNPETPAVPQHQAILFQVGFGRPLG